MVPMKDVGFFWNETQIEEMIAYRSMLLSFQHFSL